MQFNPQKNYGKIVPPWDGACFEQYDADGVAHFFDEDWKPVTPNGYVPPNVTKKPAPVVETQPAAVPTPKSAGLSMASLSAPDPDGEPEGGDLTAAEMIVLVDSMPFFTFRAHATKILGEDIPKTKPEILNALKQLVVSKTSPQPPENAEDLAPAAPVELTVPDDGEVNLMLWAAGQQNYLFSDVQAAIEAQFSRKAMSTQNAIEILIDEKVIRADKVKNVPPIPMGDDAP